MTLPPSQLPHMSRQHALLLLGVGQDEDHSPEVLYEKLEDAVFEACTFFMMRAFVPKLAEIRIGQLSKLHEASVVLGLAVHEARSGQAPIANEESASKDGVGELHIWMEAYHLMEASIKQELSAAVLPSQGVRAYRKWIQEFLLYAEGFCNVFAERHPDLHPDPMAKLTATEDFNEIKSELHGTPLPGGPLHRHYSRLRKVLDRQGPN